VIRAHRPVFGPAFALLAVAVARDAWDGWVARTVVPSTLAETSVEMLDRDGTFLRAFAVEDGRPRLAVVPGPVDATLTDMLIGCEDKRYYRHNGVDARAMLRSVGQAAMSGRVVSGSSGSTETFESVPQMKQARASHPSVLIS